MSATTVFCQKIPTLVSLTRRTLGHCSLAAIPRSALGATSHSLSTLAVLEQSNGRLSNGYVNVIAAAKQLGGPVHAFVAGAETDASGKIVSRTQGVDKVLTVTNPAYDKVSSSSLIAVATWLALAWR